MKVSLNHPHVAIVLLAFCFVLGTTSCSDFIHEKLPKVPATPRYLDLHGSIHVHSKRWKRLKDGCGTIDKIRAEEHSVGFDFVVVTDYSRLEERFTMLTKQSSEKS